MIHIFHRPITILIRFVNYAIVFLFSVLSTLAPVFSFINVKLLKLPSVISFILMGTFVSIGLIIASQLSLGLTSSIKQGLSAVDFYKFVLGMLLSFLLFESSLHLNVHEIESTAKSILSFAILGTLLSTFLMGKAVYSCSLFSILMLQILPVYFLAL